MPYDTAGFTPDARPRPQIAGRTNPRADILKKMKKPQQAAKKMTMYEAARMRAADALGGG